MGIGGGTGTSEGHIRIINIRDSLQNFERPSRNILRIIEVNNRPCLVKKVLKEKAEVLYRETKEGNVPSRGYLTLKNYCLASERIWSREIDDYQEFGGKWDNELNAVGIK